MIDKDTRRIKRLVITMAVLSPVFLFACVLGLVFVQQQVTRAADYKYEIADIRSNGNDYPTALANAPLDTVGDPWGNYNRECGSYIAWKVYETYHINLPSNWGDVKYWPALATQAHYVVSNKPIVGSVAIAQPGTVLHQPLGNGKTENWFWDNSSPGHAMWVEQVNTDGSIGVSQYNFDDKGNFSTMTVSSNNLTYIYFNQKD